MGSGRASPVVLVPTNFAGGEATNGSRSASPASFGAATGRKAGFADLEDFYADEESSSEEEEDEEEEDEEEDEEDASGSGEEESGSEEEESEEESSEDDEREALAGR
jgi:hypothetical protein